MNTNIEMRVSALTRKDDSKAVYVQFMDGKKSAEFSLPGCRMIRNEGFEHDEIEQLKTYLDKEQDTIYGMAKKVNPLNAFMGKKQGE